MISKLQRWWFHKFVVGPSLRQEQTKRKNAYDQYLQQAFHLGIQALAYGDWSMITTIPAVDGIDYNEFANNVALGMYPLCACGDWMHQHENFIGKCSICRPHFETENCQEFRFAWYSRPSKGSEIPVSVAFNQALLERD